MELLIDVLYFLSTSLLVPVVVVLLGFVAWSLLEIGGFVREAFERHRQYPAWLSFLTAIHHRSDPPSKSAVFSFFRENVYSGLLGSFSSRGGRFCESELHLGKLVSDLEIEAASRLARMSLGLRVGPMLGLMGTLIPLGPALIGLSTGDIQDMARHLVVAFSTTVLGLFVGGICYGIWLTRRHWYARDLADIEYVYRCLYVAEGEQADAPRDPKYRHEAICSPTTARK